jgi:hypothetical protein
MRIGEDLRPASIWPIGHVSPGKLDLHRRTHVQGRFSWKGEPDDQGKVVPSGLWRTLGGLSASLRLLLVDYRRGILGEGGEGDGSGRRGDAADRAGT